MALPHVAAGELITSAAWNLMVDEFNTKIDKVGNGSIAGALSVNGLLKANTLIFTDPATGVDYPQNAIGMTSNVDGTPSKWLAMSGISDSGGQPRRIALFAERTFVSGSLGIGTSTPAATLHVNGGLRIGDNIGAFMALGATSWLRFDLHTGNAAATPRNGGLWLNPTINTNSNFTAFWVSNDGTGFFASGVTVAKALSVGTTLSVNGTSFFGGAKTGYVVDLFINRVGDTLEEGDLVIIGDYEITNTYGTNNNIPIPEVDIADKAYDTRVCGIVAKVLTDSELPPMHNDSVAAKTNARMLNANPLEPEGISPMSDSEHPFHSMLAKEADENFNHRLIGPNQMGQMATLGAFAHCKVDADIAPIKAGDLLTTSPTKGHAQKVLDPKKALGAIVGKALASLESGKGKIPVMVLLQ